MKRTKKFIAFICILATALSLSACKTSSGNKSKEAFSIDKAAFTDYSKDISVDTIYNTIKQFSATDDARITGFEGEASTAEYIIKQFKELGFDVKEQSVPIKAFRCRGTEVDIISGETKKIDSHVLTYSKATPKEGITADIVFAGTGTESELENAQVKDKIVLVQRGGETFKNKVQRAFTKGAAGIVFYDPAASELMSSTLIEPANLPAVSILATEAERIKGMLASGKSVKATLKVDSETTDASTKNIIAVMKSKKSGAKNIVAGAHYDGVDTPAANDNASGIATLLEAARVLSKQSLDSDITFIAFGAEEIGMAGSTYYVDNLSSEEKSKIIAMVNLDMVGAGETLRIHTASDVVRSLPADLAVACVNKFNYKNERTAQESSDHVPFETAGIPVAYLEYGPYEDYHTDKDTIAIIQKDDLLHTCNVTINICKEIADNPGAFSK